MCGRGVAETVRILVLSDTHGDRDVIRGALPLIRSIAPRAIYHLGDLVGDAQFLRTLTEIPILSVRGNCDWSGSDPHTRIDEYGGLRIFAAHGHAHHVKQGTKLLAAAAQSADCSVALYGHTHQASISVEPDLLIVNPGSPSRPRVVYRRTIALILISDGKAEAALLDV